MKRRKRPSLRRLKARFMAGKRVSEEAIEDTSRLFTFIDKHGYRKSVHGSFVVRA